MNALVTLLVPPFADLTYALPDCFPESFWKPGMRVAVPLGGQPVRAGLLRQIGVSAPKGVRLRHVIWPLETDSLLSEDILAVLEDLARSECSPLGQVVGLTLPFVKNVDVRLSLMDAAGGTRKRKGRKSACEVQRDCGQAAAGCQDGVLAEESPAGEEISDAVAGKASYGLRELARTDASLRRILARKLCEGKARLVPPRVDAAKGELCMLACSAPWPVRPSATLQIRALEELAFKGSMIRRDLIKTLGSGGASVVRALVGMGCVRIGEAGEEARTEALNESLLGPRDEASRGFELNAAQQAAIADMVSCLDSGKGSMRLLWGVTGSGKTVVYLEAARHALESGRSVLLLAPEVALAYKLRRDAVEFFPDREVILYHGYQGEARRERTYRSLRFGKGPFIVVGTRSALFLSIPDLGLIVLDEEHDASFKQDDHVPYHAKNVAWLRTSRARALLVLGSATPDIKTWFAARQGRIPVLELPDRAGGNALPSVELVDISGMKPLGREEPQLATESLDAMEQCLARGEQAVVLLNRRGFAPGVYCTDCKKTIACPNCAVGLAYHRDEGRLVCHYCGHSIPFPAPCTTCRGMNYLAVGEGTERIADWLGTRFGCRVLRMDRDSTRRQGSMEEILADFAARKADILVGTQMISKGHHFPGVTLAVIADGDLGLSLPDYRAAERTFQLLVQSSGRAGRGESPGRVIIQTRETGHYCWQFIRESDYTGFYDAEIERRRRYRYPPFIRLAMLRISYERDDTQAAVALGELAKVMRETARGCRATLMGPVPSPISCIGRRMRFQCLVKAEDWGVARSIYLAAKASPAAARLRIQLDIDPLTML